MKRDMDLVRKILLQMEVNDGAMDVSDYRIGEHSRDDTGYHVFLMVDAGLIAGVDVTEEGQLHPCWVPSWITWAGHEFLESSRNETIWIKAKTIIKNKSGAATFTLLTQCLAAIAKSQVGIH